MMTTLDDVVIVSAGRTAIGDFGGAFKNVLAPDLGAAAMRGVIDRIGINEFDKQIDDVKFGCCVEDNRYMNIARIAMLNAGIPKEIPAMTINRVCTSAMEAIVSGMHLIRADNKKEIVLAGGLESMSTIPYLIYDMRWGSRYFDKKIYDGVMTGLLAGSDKLMGMTAEFVAEKYKISREEQDEVAYRSHMNALAAIKNGRFKDEIIPFEINKRGKITKIETDEHPQEVTLEGLAKLKPIFKPKGGTVTSGNASAINDGAAAVMIMSQTKADELGLKALAKIEGYGIAGVEPDLMGTGPIPATANLFENIDFTLQDVELIECNEAFASTYIAAEKEIGWNRDITNVNGSGISLGHPVGCTGARIVVTLLHEMIKRNNKIGMATLCGGGGLGMSLLISRNI